MQRAGAADRPPIQPRRHAQYPNQRISLDVLSLEGVKAPGPSKVLVILDEFSRYAEAFPIKNEKEETIADTMFYEYITRFGVPEEIISDQGPSFMSQLFTNLCKLLEITKLHTAAYRPQGNGGKERVHSTLYTILRMLSKKFGKDWRERLPLALYVYRNTYTYKAHGLTPHHALFGYANRHVTLEYYRPDHNETVDERIIRLQEIREWVKAQMDNIQATRNTYLNQHKNKTRSYMPGDLVKFKRHVRNKLESYWYGPAEIIRRIGPVDYELKLPQEHDKKHPVMHSSYIKPYFDNDHDQQD